MIRAAIYLRVSTDRQANEGDSIPAQREALLKYIDGRSDLILAGEYLDDGISGTKDDRDELQRLLADVDSGKVDLVLFTKLDRWFRSVRHYTATQERLDKKKVGWIAIWEPIYDTTTPAGRLIVNQMMSIAQFEAENTGQRIRQVFAYKKQKGEVVSGNIPPGYSIVDKHLIPNEMAQAVRDVFQHYADTGKLYETVRVAADGLPKTKSGMKHLLQRRTYIGEHHGQPDFCEPIVSREIFDRVQVQLSRNIKADQKHVYLFSGLVKCAECGKVMASGTDKKGNLRYHRYRCPNHYQYPIKTCDNKKVLLEHKLEEYLLDNLKPLIEDARFKAEVVRTPIKNTKKQREAIEKKLARLKDLYVNDLITLTEYKQDKERYETELSAIEVPQEPPTTALDSFDVVGGINLYHKLDDEGKRLFWRLIIKEIRFGKDREMDIIFL